MTIQKGSLQRSLGLLSCVVLVISAIIGSGVFKKVAPMSESLQVPGWVLAAWVLAGFISLFGALSNAEIAGMFAGSGGEYTYFKKIYNPFFAFLYGWGSFAAIRSASIASIAYVFAESLNHLIKLPAIGSDFSILWGLKPFDNLTIKLIAATLLVVLTFINYKGLKLGENVSRTLTFTLVIAILFLIITGLFNSNASWTNITTASSNYIPNAVGKSGFLALLFTAMLGAFWAYEGWNNIGYLGGEIKNPQRNIPLSLFIGVIIVMSIYFLLNFVYHFNSPIDDIITRQKTGSGIAAVDIVGIYLGKTGALFISCLILVTTLNATNATILMASRIYFAMGRDGYFFKKTEFVHPRYKTPSYALWIQCAWSVILLFSGSFDQLTDMLIFASFLFYGATAFGVFVMRKKAPDLERPYKVIGYPFVPAIFVLFCLGLFIYTPSQRPVEAGIGILLILTGIPFYLYWKKNNITSDTSD
ncbi:MAG: amino acid permease [Saprospiraceae bacterium]